MLPAQPIAAPWLEARPAGADAKLWQRHLLKWAALGLALLAPVWLYALFASDLEDYPPGTSFALVPILLCCTVPVILHVTSNKPFLRRVMLTGLAAKLAATGAVLYMNYQFYKAAADGPHYFFKGQLYAADVQWTGHWPLLKPFWSSNAIYMLTGALIVFVGKAMPAVNVLYALVAFWAQYLYYKAFCKVAPRGADSFSAAIMLFLFPSILFWTATVGKDAPIALAIGLVVYGFALMTKGASPSGVLCMVLGLAGCLALRPHIAAMLSIAMVLPFALSKNRRGFAGFFAKAVIAPLLIGASLYLTVKAQSFLEMKNYEQASAVLRQVGQDNNMGNSSFSGNASIVARMLAAPVLFYRPFPWEVRSLQALIAAGEGMLLLWLTWKRRKFFWPIVRRWREDAFCTFLLLFLAEFSLVYSAAITNFGLLARERVMALPMVLLLLWIMPEERTVSSTHAEMYPNNYGKEYAFAPQPVARIR